MEIHTCEKSVGGLQGWWHWWTSGRTQPYAITRAMQISAQPAAAAEQRSEAFGFLEEALRSPDMRVTRMRKLTGAPRVFLVHTADGMQLLWKVGEALGAREEAAYRLDRRLGHFALVPPVVCRELDGVKGALRFFLHKTEAAHLDPRSSYVLQTPERDNYRRVAVLDCLLGNRDRHAGNWLLTPGGTVIPIDHGRAFPRQNGVQRFAAYDFRTHVSLSAEQCHGLRQLLNEWDDVRAELVPLVGEQPVNALYERVDRMMQHGSTYDWHDGAITLAARGVRDTFEATFGAVTELDVRRPEHGIRLDEPDDYAKVLDHIQVHRYYLGVQRNTDVSLPDAAESWFDTVYLPATEAIRASRLAGEFPRSTEADLYLWLMFHREQIRMKNGEMPSDGFVAVQLRKKFSGRPLTALWKTLRRGVLAAMEAARETPGAAVR